MMNRIFTALYTSYIAVAFVLLEVNPMNWPEGGRVAMLVMTAVVWLLLEVAIGVEETHPPTTRRITPTLEDKNG